MKLTLTEADKQLTALLVGDIDHHTAKRLREEIDEKIEQMLPEVLVLDFGGVTFMDSSGIGLVMGRYNAMQQIGGSVKVINTTAHIKKIMRLSGLERLVTLA